MPVLRRDRAARDARAERALRGLGHRARRLAGGEQRERPGPRISRRERALERAAGVHRVERRAVQRREPLARAHSVAGAGGATSAISIRRLRARLSALSFGASGRYSP